MEDEVDDDELVLHRPHDEDLVVDGLRCVEAVDEGFEGERAGPDLLEDVAFTALLGERVDGAVGFAVGAARRASSHADVLPARLLHRLEGRLEEAGHGLGVRDERPPGDVDVREPGVAVLPGEGRLDGVSRSEPCHGLPEVVPIVAGFDERRLHVREVEEGERPTRAAWSVEHPELAARRRLHTQSDGRDGEKHAAFRPASLRRSAPPGVRAPQVLWRGLSKHPVMQHDVVVVGAGCIGLSVAKHLVERSDLDVAVVEKEHHLAAHQSGRNSGVLHPGFNYPPESRKAAFATEGTRRMKEYCRTHDIPLDECGVVVVAQNAVEESRLYTLESNADANGVETEILDADELREHEPYARGHAALYCPEAASVDSQQYVYQLARDARAGGADVYLDTEVTTIARHGGEYVIETDSGRLEADYLVNAAGLHADRLAHQLGVGEEYQVVPFRGEYREVSVDKRDRCRSMIYPTPDPELPFLGVHFTRQADGTVIVGPNAVLAFGREAYENTDVDLGDLAETLSYRGFWRLMASRKLLGVARDELQKSYRKERFAAAARRLVPDIEAEDLRPSYAGIRAQVVSEDGELVKEAVFEVDDRAIHVLNAVSPGLTCSLPFGEHLADRVLDSF